MLSEPCACYTDVYMPHAVNDDVVLIFLSFLLSLSLAHEG